MTLYSQRQYERKGAVVAKEAVFTMKLEVDLRDAFMAEAAAKHVPASQIVRDLMRDFIKQQREAREYDEWYRRKVEASLAQAHAGIGYSNEEVQAKAAAWRAELERQMGEPGG
jgi:predicted transcriptional regulator